MHGLGGFGGVVSGMEVEDIGVSGIQGVPFL